MTEASILLLTLVFRGRVFSLLPLSLMWVVGFLYMVIIMLRYFLPFLVCWTFFFLSWKGVEYCEIFFLHQLRWIFSLFLSQSSWNFLNFVDLFKEQTQFHWFLSIAFFFIGDPLLFYGFFLFSNANLWFVLFFFKYVYF